MPPPEELLDELLELPDELLLPEELLEELEPLLEELLPEELPPEELLPDELADAWFELPWVQPLNARAAASGIMAKTARQ